MKRDTTIKDSTQWETVIEVDLGGDHFLRLTVEHTYDPRVRLDWTLPAIVTGPVAAIRDRQTINLVSTLLDFDQRTIYGGES